MHHRPRENHYYRLEAGKQFKAIKEDLGPRKWAPWLREHGVGIDSADWLIRIVERFDPMLGTVPRIDDLAIDFRALRLLASPTAPPQAAAQAVSRAAAGEHITKAKA